MIKNLSVVVPIYNEADTIDELLLRVKRQPFVREIIAVDDGSSDGTRNILKKYEKDPVVKVVLMSKNFGKGAALREGFKHVRGEYTVIQDADLEYDPADLGKLLQTAMDKGVAVVYGNRFHNKKVWREMNWKNALGNKILPLIVNVLYRQKINDEATCYKLFKTSLLKSVSLKCERFEFCPEVTAKVSKRGHNIVEVPISYNPRTLVTGKKLNAVRDGLEAIWTLLKYRFTD